MSKRSLIFTVNKSAQEPQINVVDESQTEIKTPDLTNQTQQYGAADKIWRAHARTRACASGTREAKIKNLRVSPSLWQRS